MNTERSSLRIMPGNCLELFPQLPEGHCDCLITDPPYGTTDLEFDKVRIDWEMWWREVHRVCKPNAVLVCFAAQPFATDLIQSNRRHFRYDLIWQKTCAVGFLSANVRPLRGHELMLVFCRKFGRTAEKKMQSVYNPQFVEGKPYKHKPRARPASHYGKVGAGEGYANPGRRYPTSVLTYARDNPSLHPTAKPVDLLRWLVRTYTHPGERVLDPFMGSGSTGAACALEGRQFVGIEIDPEYYAIAEKRLIG